MTALPQTRLAGGEFLAWARGQGADITRTLRDGAVTFDPSGLAFAFADLYAPHR
jgi:hypothetical protein